MSMANRHQATVGLMLPSRQSEIRNPALRSPLRRAKQSPKSEIFMFRGQWPLLLCLAAACLLWAGCDRRETAGPEASTTSDAGVVDVPLFDFGPDVVLLVTGGGNGTLEICDCEEPPPAGLARRSGLVASYRKTFTNVLLIDAGDFMRMENDRPRNAAVMRGYAMLGYDALALGEHECLPAPAELERLLRESGAQAVRGNVASAPGQPALPGSPSAALRAGSGQVALLAYVSQDAFMFTPADRKAQLAVGGVDGLAAAADQARKAGQTVVLIAHCSEQEAAAVAAQVPADFVVIGHTTRSWEQSQALGQVPAVKVGGGAYVGAIALKLGEDGRVEQFAYRLELVDERWPADQRLLDLFSGYLSEADAASATSPS